ncbi:MAG: alanine racemase [Elusimicrobia bacterium]|jgi:alanine racemase|nr:alanine racemase [Elusimicrobiota bacterium]
MVQAGTNTEPEKNFRPTKAVISLNNIRSNFKKIKELTDAKIMPVVKADAYGHGAVRVAALLEREGSDMLGVATIEEGIKLRKNNIKIPVLVLGSVYPFENFTEIIKFNLTPIAASMKSARALEKIAMSENVKVKVHIKVDTGMGRIGISPAPANELYEYALNSKNIEPEGVFTHLSAADSDYLFTQKQIKDFREFTEKLSPKPLYVHAANSAGIMKYPASHFNLVRPGLALYGLFPDGVDKEGFGLLPALSWESTIIFLKDIKKNTPVSYGGTWRAPKPSKIATLCVGYADGYSRKFSNKGRLLIRGKFCPVVGMVCMDMIMADVSGVGGVKVGDRAVLIGESGGERITAEEAAKTAGTINYEITTSISSRVPRIFKDE